jgi:hypothetical protein
MISRRLRYGLALLIVGLGGVFCLPVRAATERDTSLRVTTTSLGVQLTMVIPKRTYPRGALVPVDVWVRNLTQQTLLFAPFCHDQNPTVDVLSPTGTVRYPPALVPLSPSRCIAGWIAARLLPHASLHERLLVVLRGRFLRAWWEYGVIGSAPHVRIYSPRVSLLLTARHLPIVTVHSSPVFADVYPQAGVQGTLRYVSVAKCGAASGSTYSDTGDYWEVASGTRITPPCPNPLAWHVLAGYVGGSVASIRSGTG